MKTNIKEIKPIISDDNRREVHVHFTDGTVVKIAKCQKSWEQWNAPIDYRWASVPIADKCNNWLHGIGTFPY